MEVLHENFEGETFEIWKNGKNPKLLIFSGMHGDEYSIIPLIKDYILTNLSSFPDFIYIPQISPSAVELETRTNQDGEDVNRSFFTEGLETSEARYLEKVVRSHDFSLLVSFHEDNEHNHFYLYNYHSSKEKDISPRVESLMQELQDRGVGLLTGEDDPSDLGLGYEFKNGYRLLIKGDFEEEGQFEYWARGIKGRILVPEIPTNVPTEVKKLIIESLFSRLILKIN